MENLDHILPSLEGQPMRKPTPKAIAKMMELALAPQPAPQPVKKPR